jgi:hypothetical protein
MFAGKLYAAIGAAPDAKLSVRFTHSGLAGRTLKSASSNRRLSEDRKSHEQLSETEAVIVLGDIKSALVDEVRRVCARQKGGSFDARPAPSSALHAALGDPDGLERTSWGLCLMRDLGVTAENIRHRHSVWAASYLQRISDALGCDNLIA